MKNYRVNIICCKVRIFIQVLIGYVNFINMLNVKLSLDEVHYKYVTLIWMTRSLD